ncbi:MAG: T9SS type A sorting domain-containing protein [Bacteroidia bacterium]|nr:T9SS type A sorting domain-containing protein [Bacteroidia bacterium]
MYFDIIPDTTISSCCYNPPAKFHLDLNNDGQNDFILTCYYRYYTMGSYGYSYIEGENQNMISVNPSNNLIADTLNSIDSICTNSIWKQKGFFTNYSSFFGDSINSFSNMEWNNLHDKYVGLKLRKYNQEFLGWVKITANDTCANTLKIESYGISHFFTQIPPENPQVIVFPNPTENFISINLPNETIQELELFNSLGEKTINKIENLSYLDLRNYPNGFYTLVIKTNERTLTEKIIKIQYPN